MAKLVAKSEKPTLMVDPSDLEKDLTGKVAIVTGANCGVGFVTAVQLARQGATVVMACRNVEAGKKAAAGVQEELEGKGMLEVRHLDLASLGSIRTFVPMLLEYHDRIDMLVNNAGVMNTRKGRTKDGFEMQIGTNHLGHFMLTALLLDRIKLSAPSRIVNLSSSYHVATPAGPSRVDLEDLHFKNKKYNGWAAYGQSKLANVLHAKGLAKRLEETGVTAVSAHPGFVRTNLIRHTVPLIGIFLQNTILRPILSRWMGQIEPWEGAQSTLHCLLNDDVSNHPGAFYSQVGGYTDKEVDGGWPMDSPNPQVNDNEFCDLFWDLSEELVKLRIDLTQVED